MLALAAADAVGVVLAGTLYAVAGADLLSQGVFLSCLFVLFALVTTMVVIARAVYARRRRSHREVDLPLMGRRAVATAMEQTGCVLVPGRRWRVTAPAPPRRAR